MIFIGIDDTDTTESRGTGYLARMIAAELTADYQVSGVIRHQLLDDPRVPCTSNNSSATILLRSKNGSNLTYLIRRVEDLILASFNPGSDPGVCVAAHVPPAITDFGRRVQRQLVAQVEARTLAARHGLLLSGLGGTQDGVIGALAAVGLAACGNDGRYVQVGRSRELKGLLPVNELLATCISAIQTQDGRTVAGGLVMADKLRPARRGGQPVAVVEWQDGHWLPLKLD